MASKAEFVATRQFPAELAHDLPATFPIFWRGSPHYETARIGRVFNQRRPSRYPIAVVEATREFHIVEAVRIAKKLNCRVSVRSGGHSWAAWSVRDEAILIDLGRYFEFKLDEESGIAQVTPSIVGRVLNRLLAEKGRFFPGGHVGEVGTGGFILQGGMGWNCRNWGWACERIKAIDCVTADGQLLRCDETQNQDLLWAAKGAGPGFPAVVTRFHLETIPMRTHWRSSAYSYSASDYRKVMDWITSITPTYDSDTEIVAVGSYPPNSSEIAITALLLTMKNSEAEAMAALQAAEDTHPPGTIHTWHGKETSIFDEYSDQDMANPRGHRYACDNAYVRNDCDAVGVMEKAFTTLPTKKSFSLWYAMAPCSRRTLPDMALSMQSDHYFATYAIWEDECQDEKSRGWVRQIMKDIAPYEEGAYLGDSDFQVRKTMFWAAEQGQKLMDIRKKRNPDGRICGYLDQDDQSGASGLENAREVAPAANL